MKINNRLKIAGHNCAGFLSLDKRRTEIEDFWWNKDTNLRLEDLAILLLRFKAKLNKYLIAKIRMERTKFIR